MSLNQQQIDKLKQLGVKDPYNLTKADIILITEEYLNKRMDKDFFTSCFESINTNEILDALKNLSMDNKEISNNVLNIIDKVLDGYKEDLKKAKTKEERQKIRDEMLICIDKAREESDSSKKLLALFGLVILAGLGAAGKYIFDKIFNKE